MDARRLICRSIPLSIALDRASEADRVTHVLQSDLPSGRVDRHKGCLRVETDCKAPLIRPHPSISAAVEDTSAGGADFQGF